MELLWTDANRKHTAEDAVNCFSQVTYGRERPWVWVSEPTGEFRFDEGLRTYRVTPALDGWQVFVVTDPGAA